MKCRVDNANSTGAKTNTKHEADGDHHLSQAHYQEVLHEQDETSIACKRKGRKRDDSIGRETKDEARNSSARIN